jgi:hypothetical protein
MTTTELLLASIDEAYDKRSWHGTNLRGSLRGVTVEQAAYRVRPGSHNIWELAVHAAYWKNDIRRRLAVSEVTAGGRRADGFALEGSDFWVRPVTGTEAEWKADLALLQDEHQQLRAAVESFPPSRWTRKAPGKPFNFEGLVRGVAAHDLYHAGQIQLLKRLQE